MAAMVCSVLLMCIFSILTAVLGDALPSVAKVASGTDGGPVLMRRNARHTRRWIAPAVGDGHGMWPSEGTLVASVSSSGHVESHSDEDDPSAVKSESYDFRKWWRWDVSKSSHIASVLQMDSGEAQIAHGQFSKGGTQSPSGLPWASGPNPSWLQRTDGLVIDARSDEMKKSGGGKLLVSVVSMDHSNTWEIEKAQRPKWLRVMLNANRAHVKKHGHAMILRWQPSQPELTAWQNETCRIEKREHVECIKRNERENINWEKHLMLSDYLNSSQNFSHVLMLDADAMFTQPDLDTMGRMAAVLEDKGRDLFTASEDWLKYGEDRLNGGVLLAKNTQWTRDLFEDLWECHQKMRLQHTRTLHDGRPIQCSSNEMVALNDWKERKETHDKLHLASGRYWNRGGEVLFSQNPTFSDKKMFELGLNDTDMEIIHFMGGAKGGAAQVLCNHGVQLTGEDPDNYGCAL